MLNRSQSIISVLLILPAAILLNRAAGTRNVDQALDRSPTDVALTPDGAWAVTANSTANTVSLIDLSRGSVAKELAVGRKPFCVAISGDGKRAAVTNWLSNSLTILSIDPPNLSFAGSVEVGEEPRGVVFCPDGAKVYVALAGEDSVVAVDLKSMRVANRLEVGTEPWHLAVSKDGKTLVVGNVRSQDVSV